MAQLEAAPAALPFRTAGEWAAHLRWRALVGQDQGLGGWAQEAIGRPIDRLEALLFRTEGVSLADKAVLVAMRHLGVVSRQTLPVGAVLDTYRRMGRDVTDLESVRQLPLDDIEHALRDVAASYLKGAGFGGALAGSLGAVGVVAGIPPLLFASLHAIHRLALLHGQDPTLAAEEHFAVLILATSLVSRPSLRAQVLHRLQAVARELETSGQAPAYDLNAGKITENVAESLAAQIVLGLFARSWPLGGLIVGVGYSRAFVARACETALAAYGQRALLRRYGDAARIDS